MPDLTIHDRDAISLLDWGRELGKEYPFFDFHVHPFDVLTGDIDFQEDCETSGVFKKGSSAYRVPSIILPSKILKNHSMRGSDENSFKAYLFASRLAYSHTGRKVFTDQLDLIGFTGAVLLPVAREYGIAQQMLAASTKMFGNENRLFLGCSLPTGIRPDTILSFYQQARENGGICVIKVHPNLMGIDVLSKRGTELMEATLVAAGTLGLPIVIHGGRTPALQPPEMREYGTISHLNEINWGLSRFPVVIAHCGCYGIPDLDVPKTITILNHLLHKYPNLMADTSNLEPLRLRFILEKVDHERLIFGSDALYVPIWKAWLQFLSVVHRIAERPDDDVIRMASLNAQYCLRCGREGTI
jgi:predicted TIM-barrel fold metal-dependent hydrolase